MSNERTLKLAFQATTEEGVEDLIYMVTRINVIQDIKKVLKSKRSHAEQINKIKKLVEQR